MSQQTPISSSSSSSSSQIKISAESLSLAASLFTSSIDNWVPKEFGIIKSESDKRREFENAFTRPLRGIEGIGVDRLGLGHPLLLRPANELDGIGGGSSKSSLTSLSKHLQSSRNGPKDLLELEPNKPEEEDETESRSAALGKSQKSKKVQKVLDLLSGKKKKQKNRVIDDLPTGHCHPKIASLSKGDNDNMALASSEPQNELNNTNGQSQTSSPGGSGDFPFQGPVSLASPQASKILSKKRARPSGVSTPDSTEDDESLTQSQAVEHGAEAEAEDGGTEVGQITNHENTGLEEYKSSGDGIKKSKTQRRREKRKKRKLQQAGSVI